jgi:hypothetical protein
VRATSDRYYCQGFDQVNLGWLLDQICIQLVGISAVVRRSYNCHDHQMPEEDQSMGAFGTPTQVLPTILVLASADRLYD